MKKVSLKLLEDTMVRYRDLINIPVANYADPLDILNSSMVKNGYLSGMTDMARILKNKIILRKTVVRLLFEAEKVLKNKFNNYSLYITYGYRSLEVQTKKFCAITSSIASKQFFSNPEHLYEEAHRFIAVPSVAGHPTGGAVDISIIDSTGKFIDFGSTIYDFSSKDCYVYTPTISKSALNNRLLLRKCMTVVGFAPFDGEWWHFSYGDREWAYYYRKPYALYNQISIKEAMRSIDDVKI